MDFDVVRGNIVQQTAHVLVNTTAPDSQMDCGVAGAFRAELGEEVIEDVRSEQPLRNGDVVVTDAYDLPALYVFHVVPVTRDGAATEASIRDTVRNVLVAVDERECRSLALPVLGCGGGGYEFEAGARHICEEIWQFEASVLADVRVVSRSSGDFKRLESIAQDVKAAPDRL